MERVALRTELALYQQRLSTPPPLAATLDDVLIAGGHSAELTLFSALAPAAGAASTPQLEWLLQRLLLMLAVMHQRGATGV